jgi:aromatic-L-amino-acid decarboxylase
MTLLERLNDGGEVFLTHTTVGGQTVLRVAIGAPATTRAHVERVWTLLREGHDWLATDFAAAAAERAAEQEQARAAAEQQRAAAEEARAAEELSRATAEDDGSADEPAQDQQVEPESGSLSPSAP